MRRGWGSVKVRAKIGKATWQTSIFPDSQAGTHLLPVKAEISRKEKLTDGSRVSVKLRIGG